MKVIGFSGSLRKDGNTAVLIQRIFRERQNEGMETEFVQLSHKSIHGCAPCYQWLEKKNEQCAGWVLFPDPMGECSGTTWASWWLQRAGRLPCAPWTP